LGRVYESQGGFTGAFVFIGLLGLFFLHKLVKRVRARRESRLRLEGDEVSQVVPINDYGAISRPRPQRPVDDPLSIDDGMGERVVLSAYYPDAPRWIF